MDEREERRGIGTHLCIRGPYSDCTDFSLYPKRPSKPLQVSEEKDDTT